MKVKSVWYLGGVLMLGLALLTVSCALIEPPVPALPVATIVPPLIPHPLEGRADCRMCHATGIAGAPQFPADHSRRPSDVCLTCHMSAPLNNGGSVQPTIPTHPVEITPAATTPASPVETTPIAVSATEVFSAKCAACHGANRQGIPGFAPALTPESLAGRNDAEIRSAISDGRPGTAMPAFKATLSPQEIDSLIQLIKSPSP